MAGFRTYARVEANALCVHANIGELDKLLKLDGQSRHGAGVAYDEVEGTFLKSTLLSSSSVERLGRRIGIDLGSIVSNYAGVAYGWRSVSFHMPRGRRRDFKVNRESARNRRERKQKRRRGDANSADRRRRISRRDGEDEEWVLEVCFG